MTSGPVRAAQLMWLGHAVLMLYGCGGGGGGGGGAPAAPNPPAPPTASITASSTLIEEGQTTELTWSSTNATSCTASDGWTGPLDTAGTRTTSALSTMTTFSVTCSGPGGEASASVTISVQPTPPSVNLEATPLILRGTQTSQLTWTSHRVSDCEALGSWAGPRPTAGTETVGPFIQSTLQSYSLQCRESSGATVGDHVLVQYRAGVNLPPTANAGPDRVVGSTHQVELHSPFSSDDHGIASAVWAQTSGPPVTLGPGSSAMSASFVAPTVTSDTVLTFSLTVTDDEGLTSAPDFMNVTVQPIPSTVTITGDVQYERVPHDVPGQGLRYVDQHFTVVRNVFVEVLDAGTQNVIASGAFMGDFQFTVPSQTDLRLRATAQISRQAPAELPHWQIEVRDLDANGAPVGEVYSYTGPPFNSGAGGAHSLQIPSGWSTSGQLIGERHAAPFAILGSIHLALDDIQSQFPRPSLPALVIDWSPSNAGGETFYTTDAGSHRIVLAGEADVDTDEYDPSVVLHEFGHFLMNTVSRDESIGGPHGLGDRLDMRVAFSEGFATAFASFVIGETGYRDSFGPGQASSGFFDVNQDSTVNEGWYNEFSVHELLWDFNDFSAIWEALHAPMQQTDAFTSVFPFFAALKQLRPSSADNLNALLANEQIVGATIDAFGTTETNNAGSPNGLPIYGSIALGGSVQVRSSNDFGTGNKLATHRYLRFSLPAPTNVRFQVTAAAGRDPDIGVFRRGVSLGPEQGAADEDFSLTLDPGEYVLDVYDCGNANCNANVTPGPTDITVSVSAN